ncbi:MAG: hypothetical protein NTX58_15475, partial [Actinobacteria bacterium]|nr:hypothetical protein [Actinomycetota bacterium]
SFLGATSALEDKEILTLVVDIGGGSTEFALGRSQVEESVSIDVGCVRMTEKFLAHDPPLPEELSNCISVIEQHLDDVAREVPGAANAARFIGLAGTVTNVAAVELGLLEYELNLVCWSTTQKRFMGLFCRKRPPRMCFGPLPPNQWRIECTIPV